MTYEEVEDCCCKDAGTAAAGVGLAGLVLGTNTGAFTACAGRAAPGVGESGGLLACQLNVHSRNVRCTYAGEGASR